MKKSPYKASYWILGLTTLCLCIHSFVPYPLEFERVWLDFLGNIILSTGHIPRTIGNESPLAYGLPWTPIEWLFGVIVAGCKDLHILFLLWIVLALSTASYCWYFLYRCIVLKINPIVAVVGLSIVSAFVIGNFQLRADSLIAIFIVFLLVVEQKRLLLWPTIILMALWANIHGSFILGSVILGIYIIRDIKERSWRRVIFGCLAISATLCTPFGISGWKYVLWMTHSWIIGYISEWYPTLIFSIFDLGIPLLACFCIIAIHMYRTKKMSYENIFSFLLIYEGLNAVRFITVALPLALPEVLGILNIQSRALSKSTQTVAVFVLSSAIILSTYMAMFLYPLTRHVYDPNFQVFITTDIANVYSTVPTLIKHQDLVLCLTPDCNLIMLKGGTTWFDSRTDPLPGYLFVASNAIIEDHRPIPAMVTAVISTRKNPLPISNWKPLLPGDPIYQVYERRAWIDGNAWKKPDHFHFTSNRAIVHSR